MTEEEKEDYEFVQSYVDEIFDQFNKSNRGTFIFIADTKEIHDEVVQRLKDLNIEYKSQSLYGLAMGVEFTLYKHKTTR